MNGTTEELSGYTFEVIREASTSIKLIYYKVIFNNSSIGYVAVSDKMLYSFAINKKYRTKVIFNQWWQVVNDLFKDSFYAMLYPNNTRAIQFLEKFGMKIFSADNGVVTLVKYSL